MTISRISKVMLLALIETVLFFVAFFIVIFGVSYFQANLFLFTDFSVLSYSVGWEKVLMSIYLGCNALFMIFISLIVIELVLFILRMMVKSVLSTYRYLSLKSTDKADLVVKKVSLITLFKWMRINSTKRAIITYIVLIVVIFGFKFVSEQIMKASDFFIYRVYENKHLYTQTDDYDFTNAIESMDEYTLQISSSVGNIHLYQMKDETQANFVYLYDETNQLASYSFIVDEIGKTITIVFNQSVNSYNEYSDTLRPQMELYLPEGLILNDVHLSIEVSGDIVVDYAGMNTLDIVAHDSEIYVSALNYVIENLSVDVESSKIRIQTRSLNIASFQLNDSEATLTLGEIYNDLSIEVMNESQLYLYNVDVDDLTINSSDSFLELREVYATTIIVHLNNDTFEHLNGSATDQPESYQIYQTESTVVLRGVESDS